MVNIMKRIYYCLVILILCVKCFASIEPWTWHFKKIFSKNDIQRIQKKHEIIFSKCDVPFFTQLIFSWNAFRPQQGYFIFYGQIRDAKTKQWHNWHKMITWGKDKQHSHFNRADSGSVYSHVRLEVPSAEEADGLRIRIVSHDGADLGLFRSISACTAHLFRFSSECFNKQLALLPSVLIKSVPKISQMMINHPKKDVLCSPTSCSMLVSFTLGQKIDPVAFADAVYDHGLKAYGSWPFNTAHAFELLQGHVLCYVMRLSSFTYMHGLLNTGIPVVASVRGSIEGAPKEYPSGHLLVVVGWDQKNQKVICHDPAWDSHQKTYAQYDLISFLRAWERSRRLVYVVEPICSS